MNAVTRERQTRQFQAQPAVRKATPLLIGLIGPSSSGKTYSALRLSTGIQRISGGDIWCIDTESNRSLHYADRFKFLHLPFGAPFSPLDYLDAIQHCVSSGAKTIIVDSMSHEHEGPGGVLEWHAAETRRLAEAWRCSEEKAQMSAWKEPKGARRRMINTIMQMNANFLFCFRAKDKLKIRPGKDPEDLGYMAIAGEELIYEMTVSHLLLPDSKGTPSWKSDFRGEQQMMKLPEQFEPLFDRENPAQLSEDLGQRMAGWAAGVDLSAETIDKLVRAYEVCADAAAYRGLEDRRSCIWRALPKETKERLKAASEAAGKRTGAPASNGGGATSAASVPPTSEPTEEGKQREAWANTLRGAASVKELDKLWKDCRRDYESRKCEVPVELEAVRNERRDAIEL